MKKILCFAFAAAATVAIAGMDNILVSFSTPGPDTYSDGEIVLDGERYALVWTPAGEEFSGVNADATAAGASKVVISAPVAKDGRCPNVVFQIDGDFAKANYPGGTWSVCLLDTRVFALDGDGKPVIGADAKRVVSSYGAEGVANGYGLIGSAVATEGGKVASAGGVAAVSGTPSADTPPPVVKGISVKGDYVYVTITSTKPALKYSLVAGSAPDAITGSDSDPSGYGSATKDIILIKKKKSGGEFFKVNCK